MAFMLMMPCHHAAAAAIMPDVATLYDIDAFHAIAAAAADARRHVFAADFEPLLPPLLMLH